MKIISVSGAEGAGKDTTANYVVEALEKEGIKAKRFSFGSGIYEETSAAFDVPIELLQNRTTKETPHPSLTLGQCADEKYVKIARHAIAKLREREAPIEMDEPLSPREMLQTWGTEYRRESEHGQKDYWIARTLAQIHKEKNTVWICSDARHTMEFDVLRPLKAAFLRINLDTHDNNDKNFLNNGHPSKWEWRLEKFDCVITAIDGQPEKGCKEVLAHTKIHLAAIEKLDAQTRRDKEMSI